MKSLGKYTARAGDDWIVVIRKVRGEETQRGHVVNRNLSEVLARSIQTDLLGRDALKGFNVWIMRANQY